MSASRSHTSAQIPGGMTSGSPQLRRRLSLPLCCHFFVSARNNIETLYQTSLVKAFFLLYNTDTVEPRMQHPWRQREHPFSSDLIALILCFPNAQIHGCGPLRASICSMSSLSHGRFPLCLLCSFLRRSCPRTGAALFCLFGSTDGSAPAVILNTKFLRHMFLFVLK